MNQQFDFSSLHVFVPGKISFSAAELRVSTNALSFNVTAAAELNYPELICVMVADDGSYLAIKAWDEPEYAVPFCTEKFRETKKRICIREKNFVGALRDKLSWTEKKSMKVNGVLYRDAGMLVFELAKAVPLGTKKSQKGRPRIEDYPTLSDVLRSLKPHTLALGPSMEDDGVGLVTV